MLQKKVCLLGSYAVGKTSLVRQFVDSIFSETYKTTIGVMIDKKNVKSGDNELTLVIWDVYGEDSHQSVAPAYMRGMAGYLLVVDLTRPNTLKSADALMKLVGKTVGDKPFVLVKNKVDLKDDWITESEDLRALEAVAFATIETSAKTDIGVDAMFEVLANALCVDARLSSDAT